MVQETQRDQTNGAGTLEESIIQQVWGIRYIDDAVARMRVAGNGSGGVAAGAAQELAFQLTDAQFSVIAVATPGKPGVVIDRIAYSPYGEATRTLRSDVNGDGFVNQSDYTGVIRPRNGATIGTAAYVVEADLDRDGKITQTDYDISIADDGKSSSGGVGEAGLFSRGVRNSVGYCGYIFNEDSGLYTVRFRTYSPTLGRWLERDPAGYVDGANLYQSVGGSPLSRNDPDGRLLVAIDGTCSREHRRSDDFRNAGGCITSHVLNFFIDYDLTSPALYLDGPDSWALGVKAECSDIEDKAYDFIVKELCKNPDEPIDLVGHSRGGYIVMQLAQRLQREGVTCPNGCKIPSPRVRFLGLYDPVDMAIPYGDGECIPGNVCNSVRLLGAGGRCERGSGATFTPKGRLLTERSRSFFNRADGPPSACSTNHRDIWIFATHSGIGGAPWCGDRPVGHDRGNDTIQAIRCDLIIRDAARSFGVPVGKKQFSDYGWFPAGSIPCGGGFLTPGVN